MNRNLIRHELSKIFGNPIFALTLMVATAISIAAAIEAWWTLETERKQGRIELLLDSPVTALLTSDS